jgi:hypothetical protein
LPWLFRIKKPNTKAHHRSRTAFQQIAEVGNIPPYFINTLQDAAGQNPNNEIMTTNNDLFAKPAWFASEKITESLDAREMLQAGLHPLAEVIKRTSEITPGCIFELITPFAPMPLIEKVKANGFEAWSVEVSDSEIHTYFYKA